MIGRHLTSRLIEALSDTAVVLVVGGRQTGKTTLVKSIATEDYQPEYVTFDDITVLNAAKTNPRAFIQTIKRPAIIDEVQRAPEILLPIKEAVDNGAKAGDFLLTGSANVLTLPNISDSLAGRIEILHLHPLSQGELQGTHKNFVETVCADNFEFSQQTEELDRKELFEKILTGGFPEAVKRKVPQRRNAWFRSYISTMLQKDIRDLANIEGLIEMPRLLTILAARAGHLINYAEISRAMGLPQSTLKRYMALLKSLFLIEEIPAYSANLTKRLTKSAKLLYTDTGLLAHVQNLNWETLKYDPQRSGLLLENFVISEIKKQQGSSNQLVEVFHFRTANGEEVDIVLELPTGEIVGLEVKAGASVNAKAFSGLRGMQEILGKKFKRGIVFYTGEKGVAFDDNLFALPVPSLWKNG